MSDLRRARRAAALLAIGLGIGLLAGVSRPQADEFDASFFKPYAPLEIAFPAYQFASFTPFEIPQSPPAYQPSEPFGAETSALVKGGLQNKWASVKNKLPHERDILAQCRANPETCSRAAKRFLAIVDKAQARDGWARIAEINRAINLTIRPVDDMAQYGVVDRWATPLMAFASNAGDCEDYAIAKYVALREIGFANDDLRIVVIYDRATNENHAVAAVRYDGRWRILDNRTLEIRSDVDIAEFNPLFVIDHEGVRRIITSVPKPPNPWANVGPANPWANVGPAAVHLQFSSGWQSAPLLL